MHHFNAYHLEIPKSLRGLRPLGPHRGSALDAARGPEAGPWATRRKGKRFGSPQRFGSPLRLRGRLTVPLSPPPTFRHQIQPLVFSLQKETSTTHTLLANHDCQLFVFKSPYKIFLTDGISRIAGLGLRCFCTFLSLQ